MGITTEKTFETAIVQSLIDNGGYTVGNAADYSPELGLFKYEVLHSYRKHSPKTGRKFRAYTVQMLTTALFNAFTKKWICNYEKSLCKN